MPYKNKDDQRMHDAKYRLLHRDWILKRDRINAKKYYAANKIKICERQKEYDIEHPECNRVAVKRYKVKNPEKVKAQYIVKQNIPLFEKCELCGAKAEHRHHPDYERPLLVVHVCARCHKAIHQTYEEQRVRFREETDRD